MQSYIFSFILRSLIQPIRLLVESIDQEQVQQQLIQEPQQQKFIIVDLVRFDLLNLRRVVFAELGI